MPTTTESESFEDTDLKVIENEYNKMVHIYKLLEEEGKHILQIALNDKNIKIHTILSRVKDKVSFLQKVQRKKTNDPFNDITDTVGLRVVCLFLSDIDKIANLLFHNFEIISQDNKITDPNNSNMFGYMSAHYIVKMKEQYTGPRYDTIKNIAFEIQIRTISMDAWANISHFLEYKSENDIPPELKRDFNALSGLFYVADTHFELFYKDRKNNQSNITEQIEALINKRANKIDTPLNFDSLVSYMKNKFADREHNSNSEDISILVTELIENGYTTIQMLDEAIEQGLLAFSKFEEDTFEKGFFSDVALIRVAINMVNLSDNKNQSLGNYDSRMLNYIVYIKKGDL